MVLSLAEQAARGLAQKLVRMTRAANEAEGPDDLGKLKLLTEMLERVSKVREPYLTRRRRSLRRRREREEKEARARLREVAAAVEQEQPIPPAPEPAVDPFEDDLDEGGDDE